MAPNLSRYLEHLPAIFREGDTLGHFLLAFERVLTGWDSPTDTLPPGLEQVLDNVHTLFAPGAGAPDQPRAPDEFLPWLASWVAASLRDDWDTETRRRFIQNTASLYRKRGTPEGLKEMLQIYLGRDPATDHDVQVQDRYDVPHYFQVSFTVRDRNPAILGRMDRIARAIIDQEKPAHTWYGLVIRFPTMQIVNQPKTATEGVRIGLTTVLGTSTFQGEK